MGIFDALAGRTTRTRAVLVSAARRANRRRSCHGADKALVEREPRGFGAVGDAELAIDVRQVELDGLLGDPELLADRLVGEPACDRPEDFRLAIGEPRHGGRRRARALHDGRRLVDGRLHGLAERRRQVERVDALDDVGRRARGERGAHVLVVIEGREDDHLDVRVTFADRFQARKPVDPRQAQVEQHEVGVRPVDERQHLAARLDFPDDLDVRSVAERPSYCFEHQPVVVGDEDADLLRSVSHIDRSDYSRIFIVLNSFT